MTTPRAMLNLIIDSDIWEQFKENVPRTMTMNDAVVSLIIEAIEKGEEIPYRGR